jgi:hypothetical protein
MRDPRYRTIYQTGYSWLEEDSSRPGEFHLEIGQEDEDARKFYVYRFRLDQMAEVLDSPRSGRYLVPRHIAIDFNRGRRLPHHISEYEEWYVKSLRSIAGSAGTTEKQLRRELCSEDPRQRASAYESIGGHWGFDNFDGYPLVMGYKEFEHYWSNEAGEPEPEEEE